MSSTTWRPCSRHASGSASLFGHLGREALAAAQQGLAVDRLALYEPPYVVDPSRSRPADDVGARIQALVSQGHRDGR